MVASGLQQTIYCGIKDNTEKFYKIKTGFIPLMPSNTRVMPQLGTERCSKQKTT
jgi:hypothetical protein